MIHAKVPVKHGRFTPDGDYVIAGCPGAGAKIELSFMDPGGAATGRLLPTGNVTDELTLESGERYTASVVRWAGLPAGSWTVASLFPDVSTMRIEKERRKNSHEYVSGGE
jgi:hypothetical protein